MLCLKKLISILSRTDMILLTNCRHVNLDRTYSVLSMKNYVAVLTAQTLQNES
jgi:hypothetical protein